MFKAKPSLVFKESTATVSDRSVNTAPYTAEEGAKHLFALFRAARVADGVDAQIERKQRPSSERPARCVRRVFKGASVLPCNLPVSLSATRCLFHAQETRFRALGFKDGSEIHADATETLELLRSQHKDFTPR